MYYVLSDGRNSGRHCRLWCVNAGHGRKRVAEAVERQLLNLDFAPTFQMGHPIAFEFAERLAEIAPGSLDRVFFDELRFRVGGNGARIALAYQRVIGQGTRTRLIGRERGYHGVGFGGGFGRWHREQPARFSAVAGRRSDDTLRTLAGTPFREASPSTVRTWLMILSASWRCMEPKPLRRSSSSPLRVPRACSSLPRATSNVPRHCEQAWRSIDLRRGDHRVRSLGAPFAADYFRVKPDLISTAKGLTNGCVPMGAVFANRVIHDDLMTGPES